MRSLALMYHRINTLKPDPWTTCVSPEHFREHLEVISQLPFPVEITFDDGYADNFEHAKPLLEKFDQPATVFVTSGMVDSPYEIWWDELERKYLTNTPATWDWDDLDPDQGATEYRRLFHRYRQQPFPIYESRPLARRDRRMMSEQELCAMASGGLITIGAHTVRHPVLSRLSLNRQCEEIAQSRIQLEKIIGKPVNLFAYPNGGTEDYSVETVRLAQACGFEKAYAAWAGPVDDGTDPFRIPRVMIRDWNGDTFASVLHATFSR